MSCSYADARHGLDPLGSLGRGLFSANIGRIPTLRTLKTLTITSAADRLVPHTFFIFCMSLALFQQFHEALKRAKRPVVVLRSEPTVDDFTAAFSIVTLCKTLGVPCPIVTSGGRAPEALTFLSTAQNVIGDLGNINALTLRVDLNRAKVDGLTYAVDGNDLVVTITPKTGAWQPSDVRIASDDYRFDLVIAIGTPDRSSLGALFPTYADFFLKTPTIVIDHGPENEHFGTINIVDLTATSVSEVCFNLFMHLDASIVTPDVATTLLTGMMSKTKSFRAPNVSPKTLEIAQKLMEKNANREAIVEHLYRTRSVETLRLWGRALARLKADESIGLVWTLITKQDFVTAGAGDDALRDIADELLLTSPSAKVALILFETQTGTIAGQLFAQRPFDALLLGAPFRATGTREFAHLSLTQADIVSAERGIISHLKTSLRQK